MWSFSCSLRVYVCQHFLLLILKTDSSSFCVLCFLYILFWVPCHLYVPYSFCVINVFIDTKCSLILFSLYINYLQKCVVKNKFPEGFSNFLDKFIWELQFGVLVLAISILPITWLLEKTFFAVTTFEDFWVVFFQTEQKACSIIGSEGVFLGFLEKSRLNKHCLLAVDLFF